MPRSKFLFAAPDTCADLLHAARFRAPDAFAYLEHAGKKHILLNDLEIDRARAEAPVDFVDSYSETEKTIQKSDDKRPAPAKVIAAWLTSKGATSLRVPEDFPLGLARSLTSCAGSWSAFHWPPCRWPSWPPPPPWLVRPFLPRPVNA